MLTIAKLGVGQENYYLAKVARGIEDYYTGDGETPGAWLGRGATRLGLAGDVPGAQLRAALSGLDPSDGDRLAGREGAKRVPGWDMTFCAPKSVSVLYGLGDTAVAHEVVTAHETAVAEAVRYLEQHATVSRRRVDGLVQQVRAEGLVIAAFRHRTSRAGDPHLHTHALAANMVERVGGGWGALHSPVLYRHARTAGFVYQAILRGELSERLGVSWEPVHNGYAEVSGIDRSLIDCFSKRRADIDAALDGLADSSARAAEIAQRRTKAAKEYGVDPATLHERWDAEAREAGLDPRAVVAGAMDHPAPTVSDADLGWAIDDMTSSIGLTAHQASFDRRDVTRAWCEALPAGVKATFAAIEDLTDVALSDRRVIPIVDRQSRPAGEEVPRRADGSLVSPVPAQRRWSTAEMLSVEQRLLDHAAASRNVGAGCVPAEVGDAVLRDRMDLSDEQSAMVHALTTSGDGIDVVVGRAGTGKTYALAAAAQVWRAAGFHPIGIALAARAAAELETAAGISSTTVAQFLLDADHAPRGLIDDHHVVVVDEAGMVDTRRLARVVRHAEAAGAKVVLVGDHHQLPAVEAGGAFAALVARLESTELTENRRQVQQWEREALDGLRVGAGGRPGIESVIATYGDHDRLHFGVTPAEVRAAMVADWYHAHRRGARAAMVALRRSDVDELNGRARALLVADGSVAADGISRNGRTFGAGDRIVCLNNDRRIGVHNAMFGHVVGIDSDARALTVQAERGDARVVVPWDYIAEGHVAHGYATTIHKAQGATYDRTLLLGDDRLYRQAGYTGLSRGAQRNDMYLVVDDDREHDAELARHGQAPPDEPIERLVKALHRDGAKLLATEERTTDRSRVASISSLVDLWHEREEFAARLRADVPADCANAMAILTEAASEARARAANATLQRTASEERVAIAPRRLRGRVRRDLERLATQEGRLLAESQELEEQLTALERIDAEHTAWGKDHARDLDRLAGLDREITRRARLAARAAEIEQPARITDVIGDPPTSLAARERWRDAAAAIESYEARWAAGVGMPVDGETPAEQLEHRADVAVHVASLADATPSDAAAMDLA